MKHISPFRYPGGKTWLVPTVIEWLRGRRPEFFIESFAGGASVGLAVAAYGLAEHVVLNELDDHVAAVWTCCTDRPLADMLCQRIAATKELTPVLVDSVMGSSSQAVLDRAFRTIIGNRISRGGITAKGAGRLKRGENGRGINSRWYPETLAGRIAQINQLAEDGKLSFVHGDAFALIEQHPTAVHFVDPPYTAGNGKRAGKRLYDLNELDHERLFASLSTVTDFMLTYDHDATDRFVVDQADCFGFYRQQIAMTNTHHKQAEELLITKHPLQLFFSMGKQSELSQSASLEISAI